MKLIKENKVSTAQIPVQNAGDLLALTHAIEAASQSGNKLAKIFNIEPTGKVISNDYLDHFDEFAAEVSTQNGRST